MREIHAAFNTAPYHCVFPIKINLQRHLVDVLLSRARSTAWSVEVGSKPEFLAVMPRARVAGRVSGVKAAILERWAGDGTTPQAARTSPWDPEAAIH